MEKRAVQRTALGPTSRPGIRRSWRTLFMALLLMLLLRLLFKSINTDRDGGLTSGVLPHPRPSEAPQPAANSTVKYMFVFGDSYTTTGFSINGSWPSSSNPLGNPALPGWTSSGGMNWPGYLATGFNRSLIHAYVLAVGGATVDSSIIPPYSSSVSCVNDQVKTWTAHLASRPSHAPWTAQNALFAVWIGVNDVGSTFMEPGADMRLERDLNRLFVLLGDLYTNGARQFGILNIPPTHRTPRMRWLPGVPRLVSSISMWNSQLPARIAAFEVDNAEASVTLINTQEPWEEVLAHPGRYGAPDASCIHPDGTSCLWHDDYHPGLAIQYAVAETVTHAYNGTFFH